jgi:hypothetical protein
MCSETERLVALKSLRSWPAQKTLPAPVSSRARTVSSLATCFRASWSSSAMALFKAFAASGRLRVMVATPSLAS